MVKIGEKEFVNGDIYYKVYTIDENGEVTDKDTKENPNKKAKSFTK